MGKLAKLKQVVGEMTLQQKLAVIAIAVLIPLGAWMGLGFPTTKEALGILGASEASNIITAIEIIFGVTSPVPPTPTPS